MDNVTSQGGFEENTVALKFRNSSVPSNLNLTNGSTKYIKS